MKLNLLKQNDKNNKREWKKTTPKESVEIRLIRLKHIFFCCIERIHFKNSFRLMKKEINSMKTSVLGVCVCMSHAADRNAMPSTKYACQTHIVVGAAVTAATQTCRQSMGSVELLSDISLLH